jgi:folate-dependent phosphoribosylglycinamide formyltransferase PurN
MYGDSVDSLTERIREVEHRLVPEVVRLFAAGRVRRDPVERRRVEVVAEEVE